MSHEVRRTIRCVLLALAFFASTTPALPQGFDCKEASTPIEHAICSDKAVADMDAELSGKYQEALVSHATNKVELVSSERRWISLRDAQCLPYINNFGDMDDCLRAAYGARLRAVASGDFLCDIRPAGTASAASTASCRKTVERAAASAPAAPPRLSPKIVRQLADAASKKFYDVDRYMTWGAPRFDRVTRVWTVEYHWKLLSPKQIDESHFRNRFYVFVYDQSAQTQVTCLGLYGVGSYIPLKDLPTQVRRFVPKDGAAIDLYCADLNGTGRSDYLLLTADHKVTVSTRRTLQILVSGPDDELRSVVKNSDVVQPPIDDAFGGYTIIPRRNRFEVMNTVAGMGGGDTHVFYFQYSPHERTWLLTRVEKELTGYAHSDDDVPYAELPDEFGRITIQNFDLRRFKY